MPWFAGAQRDEIDWGPTIDPTKCVSCGMCMNCGKKVYDWVDGGPVVSRRLDCVVGCSTCGNLCLARAISFPALESLRAQFKRLKVWSKVKRQLVADGKLPADHPASLEAPPDDRAV